MTNMTFRITDGELIDETPWVSYQPTEEEYQKLQEWFAETYEEYGEPNTPEDFFRSDYDECFYDLLKKVDEIVVYWNNYKFYLYQEDSNWEEL